MPKKIPHRPAKDMSGLCQVHSKMRGLKNLTWEPARLGFVCKAESTCKVAAGEHPDAKIQKPCRFFSRGQCVLENCKFLHLTPDQVAPTGQIQASSHRGRPACRYFMAGTCNRGDHC